MKTKPKFIECVRRAYKMVQYVVRNRNIADGDWIVLANAGIGHAIGDGLLPRAAIKFMTTRKRHNRSQDAFATQLQKLTHTFAP